MEYNWENQIALKKVYLFANNWLYLLSHISAKATNQEAHKSSIKINFVIFCKKLCKFNVFYAHFSNQTVVSWLFMCVYPLAKKKLRNCVFCKMTIVIN